MCTTLMHQNVHNNKGTQARMHPGLLLCFKVKLLALPGTINNLRVMNARISAISHAQQLPL